ncbi:hypothetical protein IEQ34_004388 [Dendrobium chrysotoxum]|uniref:Uncharacterized protein n=1 Tax=Dendrobium chrysotoxum TaxID=161865 RepID=A0AAV7HI74_DENCH|nr:hypothetical protein IEQ34_004388 [Dendrobium chrysotoxum]
MDWFCPSWESSDILRGLERFAVDDQAGNLVLDANNLDRLSATIAASIRSLGHTYLNRRNMGSKKHMTKVLIVRKHVSELDRSADWLGA